MDTLWRYLTVPQNICYTVPIAVVFLYAIIWRIITLIWQTDVETKSITHQSVILRFLNAAGVSFKIVVITLMITWGFAGLIANNLLNAETVSSWNFGLSIIIAFIASVIGTRFLLLTFTKLFSETDTVDISEPQLLGLEGIVTSDNITQNEGTAQVKMPDGQTIIVQCRVGVGEPNPTQGDKITFIDYDLVERIFDIKPVDKKSEGSV
ncbi:DUF1449 family protein [Candidatus Poribacteria bacterium]|nr:DUF1449 family protein [Candidatus Poribacteria bacterium]